MNRFRKQDVEYQNGEEKRIMDVLKNRCKDYKYLPGIGLGMVLLKVKYDDKKLRQC